jgi:uncharacterized YccA/Bax inhibitor family protein
MLKVARCAISVFMISKCRLAAWLDGDHLLLRDFGPYGIIFMNVRFVIAVAMVILLWDFGPYGTVGLCMTVCLLL